MKKLLFAIIIALPPLLACAQNARRPILDITANPKSWSDQQANLCAQVMTIPKVGLCFSGNFSAAEGVQGNFLAQSTKWFFHSEMRIFPFGEPHPIKFKSTLRAFEKRRRGYGCFGIKDAFLEKAATAVIKGIYIAPGFLHQRQDLNLIPLPDLESPIKDFKYKIKSNGATLALGCQLRLWHITIGAGWAIQVTKPRWAGPADIFGNDLYTTTFPWKLNIQHGPRFEVGINF